MRKIRSPGETSDSECSEGGRMAAEETAREVNIQRRAVESCHPDQNKKTAAERFFLKMRG